MTPNTHAPARPRSTTGAVRPSWLSARLAKLRAASLLIVAPMVMSLLASPLPSDTAHAAASAAIDVADSTGTAVKAMHPVRRPIPSKARRSGRPRLGAHVAGMSDDPRRLADYERLVRSKAAVASIYWGHGDVFPGTRELALADQGRRDLLLSWDMGATRFTDFTSGSQDAYLDTIANAALAYPYVFYVRPWPEMNGDWQDFQPTPAGERPYGGTPAEFVAAWRHLVNHFRARGVSNIRWVFNPTVDVYPGTTPVETIWPGTEYVDVLGIDGFNWGRDDGWGKWLSFNEVFSPMYERLTKLHPTAPVWICEVSSKEPRSSDGAPRDPSQSKATWIEQALQSRQFPRVTTLVWFHERKERDWRVNSSTESLQAFRRQASAQAARCTRVRVPRTNIRSEEPYFGQQVVKVSSRRQRSDTGPAPDRGCGRSTQVAVTGTMRGSVSRR